MLSGFVCWLTGTFPVTLVGRQIAPASAAPVYRVATFCVDMSTARDNLSISPRGPCHSIEVFVQGSDMTAYATTLLIVEDDSEIRQLISDFMRQEGFVVEAAADAAAMDAILARMRPDLVIL